MGFPVNITNAFIRVATEFKAHRAIQGVLANLTTAEKGSLVGAINEVNAKPSGGATTLDALTDVMVANAAAGHVLRHDGTQFVNMLGTTHFQPRDSDLDAIAALATTAYGRAFLALADQAALTALLPLDNDAALTANSPTVIATQQAVKAYADSRIAAMDAFVAKGGIDASTNPNYPAANAGHTYRVTAAGRIGGGAGPRVEVGDLLQCFVDNSAAGTHAAVGANWAVLQVNIDGAVTGPAASTNLNLAFFDGATGKAIQDAGVALDTDGGLAANSDLRVPTQKAVRAYTYSKAEVGDPETNYVTAFENALT